MKVGTCVRRLGFGLWAGLGKGWGREGKGWLMERRGKAGGGGGR